MKPDFARYGEVTIDVPVDLKFCQWMTDISTENSIECHTFFDQNYQYSKLYKP
jgi:hypothetical protein